MRNGRLRCRVGSPLKVPMFTFVLLREEFLVRIQFIMYLTLILKNFRRFIRLLFRTNCSVLFRKTMMNYISKDKHVYFTTPGHRCLVMMETYLSSMTSS